jgi:hypothetical protein
VLVVVGSGSSDGSAAVAPVACGLGAGTLVAAELVGFVVGVAADPGG